MIRNSSTHPIQKKSPGEKFHFNAIQQVCCTSAPSSASPSPSRVIRGNPGGNGSFLHAKRWDILGVLPHPRNSLPSGFTVF